MSKWIKCSEQLPHDSEERVYAYNENHNYSNGKDAVWVSVKENNQSWNSEDWLVIDGVTHWMLVPVGMVTNHENMPEPPEEECHTDK